MERNQYVILGIDFGASRAQANSAFVRRARAVRRGTIDGDLTDLTWALNRIDEADRDPALDLRLYRVPADPGVFAPDGAGVLRPGPERLAARGGDRDVALAALCEQAALEHLRSLVLLRGSRLDSPNP